MDTVRPAPPPAYNTVQRVTRGRSLRPIVLFCTLCSFIWSTCIAVAYIKETLRDGVSGKLLAVYIVQIALFAFLAGLELVGFYAAWKQQVKAGKLYTILVIIGGLVTVIAEVVRLAMHFPFKRDIISACEVQNRADTDNDLLTVEDIANYCENRWSNYIWRDAVWIVFGAICAIFMYILAKAYLHQLMDPNFGRQHEGAASSRFAMGPVETHSVPYGHGGAQDPPFVPPYGGPSNAAPGYAAPPTYDAPAYTPAEKGNSNFFSGSDSKDGSRFGGQDSKGDDQDAQMHDRDLAGRAEHNPFGRSDSEVTLQGREREGRV